MPGSNIRYFVQPDGTYIGAFQGAQPPAGAVEVPTAPEDARQKWVFADGAWTAKPTPRYRVPKLTIVDRLIAAGKLDDALTLIEQPAMRQNKARWDAALEVWNDDPTALSIIIALGLNPSEILAP